MSAQPRVVLRPVRAADLELVVEPDDESPFERVGPRATPAAVPACKLDEDGVLAIEVDGEFAGVVGWSWVRWGPTAASRAPRVGMRLLTHARGRGIGVVALREVVDLIFRHTTANRVEGNADIDNRASQRVVEKVGFTREGVVRGAHWRDGAHRDSPLYSILRAEWADRRA